MNEKGDEKVDHKESRTEVKAQFGSLYNDHDDIGSSDEDIRRRYTIMSMSGIIQSQQSMLTERRLYTTRNTE